MGQFFADWLVRWATLILVVTFGVVIFVNVSHLPFAHPLFGVFIYALVPILFIVGGVVFILVILRR